MYIKLLYSCITCMKVLARHSLYRYLFIDTSLAGLYVTNILFFFYYCHLLEYLACPPHSASSSKSRCVMNDCSMHHYHVGLFSSTIRVYQYDS